MLHEIGHSFSRIITIEDGIRKGGMGSAVLEFMADNGYTPHVQRIGVPDTFIEHGTVQELYHLCGMDEKGILESIIKRAMKIIIAGAGAVGTHLAKIVVPRKAGHHIDGRQ